MKKNVGVKVSVSVSISDFKEQNDDVFSANAEKGSNSVIIHEQDFENETEYNGNNNDNNHSGSNNTDDTDTDTDTGTGTDTDLLMMEDSVIQDTLQDIEGINQKNVAAVNNIKKAMKIYHDGNDAQKQEAKAIVCENMKNYIYYIVQRHFSTYARNEMDDLVSLGYLGILASMDKYDENMSSPTTYFSKYITHCIVQYITKESGTTPHYHSQTKKILAEKKRLEALHIVPDVATLSRNLKISGTTIQQCLEIEQAHQNEVRLDAAIEDGTADDISNHAQSRPKSPEEEFFDKQKKESLISAVKALPEIEKQVILLEYDNYSKKKIAKELNIPVDSVRKIENRAYLHLQNNPNLRIYNKDYLRDKSSSFCKEESLQIIPTTVATITESYLIDLVPYEPETPEY